MKENRHKLKREIQTGYKEKSFHCEERQALERIVCRSCTISILEYLQDLPTKCSEQLGLMLLVLLWSWGLDWRPPEVSSS